MKVRTKLTVGFLVIVLILWTTVFLAVNTYSKIHDKFELLEADIIPGEIAMSEMEMLANEAAHELMDYVVFGGEEDKQITLSATKDLEMRGLEHLQHETHIGQEEQKVAEELMVKINTFTSAVVELIALKEQGVSVDELLNREDETIHPALGSLVEQIREHKAVHMEELAAAEEAVYKAESSGILILFVVAGLATLVAAAVRFFTVRSIAKPLRALHEGTEIIGQGNLDYKVGTKAKDEIGQLSRAFDQMTDDLTRTTTSIENINKEITERKRAEEQIRNRLVIEDAIARASRLLAYQQDADIKEILKILGEAVSVNRAYVFQFRQNGRKIDNTHEWCAPGTEPQIDNLQDLDSALVPWWMKKLGAGENIVIPDVGALPAEAAAEKEMLQAQDIRSLLVVPIYLGGGILVGFMGFDDTEKSRQWSSEDVSVLRVMAETMAGYLDRKQAEEKLHKTLGDLERFNRLAVGREQQMIELKREVNDLLRSLGRQEKYRIPTLENDKNIRGR